MIDDSLSPASPGGVEPPLPPPPPSQDSHKGSHRRALFIVFLVVFIDLFGFGLVLPLLPRYGKDFILPMLGYPVESTLGEGYGLSTGNGAENEIKDPRVGIILGALLASFSLMQFVFAPIWGRVSDRVGRRPLLLMGLASSVVFYSVFGIASMLGYEGQRELGLILLFVSRIGAGIAGATLGTAQAAIADSTTAENRSRGMALIGAAFGIGFFFGPLLGYGAFFVFPGFAGGPGFLAAVLSLVALVLGLFLLPETLQPGVSPHARRQWLNWRSLQAALRTPVVGTLIGIFFLATLSFANFEPTLALLTTSPALKLTDQNNFLVFAYVGLILGLAQGLLYRPLAKRVREITFMLMGALLMVLGLLGVGAVAMLAEVPDRINYPTLMAGFLVTLAVAITGFAFMTPSVQSLISRRSDPGRQGEILGVNQSASAMARILGGGVGIPLYLATASHVLPYAFGAGLLMIVFLLTLRIRQS